MLKETQSPDTGVQALLKKLDEEEFQHREKVEELKNKIEVLEKRNEDQNKLFGFER